MSKLWCVTLENMYQGKKKNPVKRARELFGYQNACKYYF